MSWAERRRIVLKLCNHTCRYCGDYATHVDHVIPKSRGGSDEFSNLVAACARCNLRKWAHITPQALRMERLLSTEFEALREMFAEWDEYDEYLRWCDEEALAA